MIQASEVKVGFNKNAPRVWIDGGRVSNAGFEPGRRYECVINLEERRLTLALNDDGRRVVSRKGDKPVIDLNSHEVVGMFEGLERLRVVIGEGVIHLLPTAAENRRAERLARLATNLARGELQTGSLSHGGGVLDWALDEGAKETGLSTSLQFANDIRPELLEQAMLHNPAWTKKTIPLAMPMQDLAFDSWVMSKLPKVDWLSAGIPCEGASLAGKAKNGNSMPEQHPLVGHLVVAFLAVIAAVNPAIITLENVPGYQNSASMAIIRNQLRDMDYDIHEAVLDSVDFGVIEKRSRLAMVAVTKGVPFSFDWLEKSPQPTRLGDVLEPIPSNDSCWSAYSYLVEKEKRDKDAGKGFSMQIVTPDSPNVGTIGKGYAKVRSTEPKLAHPTDPALMRQLTPVEHARVKGIDESLITGLSATLSHELLGQSVIGPVFKAVGKLVGLACKMWQEQSCFTQNALAA